MFEKRTFIDIFHTSEINFCIDAKSNLIKLIIMPS